MHLSFVSFQLPSGHGYTPYTAYHPLMIVRYSLPVPALCSLLILCMATACRQNEFAEYDKANAPVTSTVTLSGFPAEDSLKPLPTGLNFAGTVDEMDIIDSILVVSVYKDSLLLKLIGTGSHKLLTSIIPKGKQDNAALNITDIIATDSPHIFWAFDVTLARFLRINTAKALAGAHPYLPDSSFSIRPPLKGIKSPVWSGNGLYAACSYFEEDCRMLHFNTASAIVSKSGILPPALYSWPDPNPDSTFGIAASAYPATLKKHPGQNKYLVAYSSICRLEIFSDDTLFKVIKGPGNFVPDYNFIKDHGIYLPNLKEETQFAFTRSKVTKDHIFLLYSGNDHFNTCGNKLLVFDWQGRPVKKLLLPSDACNFSVRANGSDVTVYLMDKSSGDINRATFTL